MVRSMKPSKEEASVVRLALAKIGYRAAADAGLITMDADGDLGIGSPEGWKCLSYVECKWFDSWRRRAAKVWYRRVEREREQTIADVAKMFEANCRMAEMLAHNPVQAWTFMLMFRGNARRDLERAGIDPDGAGIAGLEDWQTVLEKFAEQV